MSNSTARKVEDAFRRMDDKGIPHTLTHASYEMITKCDFTSKILWKAFALAQIMQMNNPISVRGAFYRAVCAGVFPDTADANYRQVGAILCALRRRGGVPNRWFADSTRTRTKPSSWTGLQDFGETVVDCYRKDFWAGQESCIEFAVEKDAMAGTLSPVLNEYDVNLSVIRGNVSETFAFAWAEQLDRIQKPVTVYYLGDYDPNGLDIERDLRKRLTGFCSRPLNWERLAITAADFARNDLLGFPTRKTNSRGWQKRLDAYTEAHGDRCVEVDAIPPKEMRARVKAAIESHINQAAWNRLKQVESLEKATVLQVFGSMGKKVAA